VRFGAATPYLKYRGYLLHIQGTDVLKEEKKMFRFVNADFFKYMVMELKRRGYVLLAVSHKEHEARFVFQDVECPFTYDLFPVITYNKYGGISYEKESLYHLSQYEQSKITPEMWEKLEEMRVYSANEWQKLDEECKAAEAKKQEVA
jgi:hypothetical protein